MELLEFRNIDRSFRFDLNGEYWSRIYEYPLILDLIEKYGGSSQSIIHNTCWGYEGVHIWFKNILENKYINTISSDKRSSKESNTYIYNLGTVPKFEWQEHFDFVINISTLEEISLDHIEVFKQTFTMVKPGGYFLLTFDLPGLQVQKFEKFFNKNYMYGDDPISGNNSERPMIKYKNLNCGYMVVRKQNT